MIFDKNYDNILWLLIQGDKKNRDRIIDFIVSIPNELLINIRNTIIEFNNYKLDNENIGNKFFNGQIYNSNGSLYSFNIDSDNGNLKLSRSVNRYGLIFNDFDLVLNNIAMLNECSKDTVGYLAYDYDCIFKDGRVVLGDCTRIEYKLVKLPFGNILLSLNEDEILKNRIGIVNKDILNNNYIIDDIKEGNINNLIKCKKIN